MPHDLIGRRADGARLPLVATVAPLALADGTDYRVVVVRDFGAAAPVAPRRRPEPVHALLAAIGDQLYAFAIGGDGTIATTFAGPGGERILGGTLPDTADLVTAWTRAVHPDDRPAFERHLVRLSNGESTEDSVRIIGLDGATRWISFRAWPASADGIVIVHGIAADVTGKMALERVLKATVGAARREADALEEARREADHLARTDSLTGVFNRRHLNEQLAAALAGRPRAAAPRRCCCSTSTTSSASTTPTATPPVTPCWLPWRGASPAPCAPATSPPAGAARSSACCSRASTDDGALREIGRGRAPAHRGDPVMVEGVEIAVTVSVGAARATTGLLGADDLVDAADRALYAAKRRGRNQTRLYSEWLFEDFVAEDPEAVRIAEALALTASLREGTSSLHPMQVADLAMRTAEQLGSASPVVLRCRLGGWLHDVGKVAIPDEILSKRGPLDAVEQSVMQRHPEIGAEIIQRVAGLKEAVRAVRHHHERWDGTGYPEGLAGESIPIEARIVAAADVYSAMTSDRTYRRALERAEALARAGAPGRDPARSARRAGAGAGADRGPHPPRLAVRPQRRRRRAPRRPAPRRGRVGRYGGAQSPAWSSGSVAQMATACASVPSRSPPPTV